MKEKKLNLLEFLLLGILAWVFVGLTFWTTWAVTMLPWVDYDFNTLLISNVAVVFFFNEIQDSYIKLFKD